MIRSDEEESSWIGAHSVIKGEILVDGLLKIEGKLIGSIKGLENSTVIIGQSGYVQGNIEGSEVWIDGTVEGTIQTHSKVHISRIGKIKGDIRSNQVTVDFGAIVDGSIASLA